MLKNKIIISVLAVFTLLCVVSCGIYSFTGTSISPTVKTVQIDYFPNNAPLVNPTLSNYFTNELQDIFMSRTSLQQVKANGDLQFEGEIVRYDQTSVAPTVDASTGKAIAGKVRLTIAIKVRFYNNKDETQNFDTQFSNFADIEGSETLSGSQEQKLVEEIIERIVNDVFTQSVAQW